MKNGKIAYIMSRFPHLPETFILREMNALSKLGWDISLFPLILQKDKVVHTEAIPWLQVVKHSRFLSFEILIKFAWAFIKSPIKFIKIFSRIMWESKDKILKIPKCPPAS